MIHSNGKIVEMYLNTSNIVLIDEVDFFHLCGEHVSQYGNGYLYLTSGLYKDKLLHRIIAERAGIIVDNEEVDHKDLNLYNCSRVNLRIATSSQNKMNRYLQSNSSSGYKGVSQRKDTGRHRAYIKLNGVQESLGCFDTAEEAYRVYCEAAIRTFGEFANLG